MTDTTKPTLSDEERANLKAKAERATPGPWRSTVEYRDGRPPDLGNTVFGPEHATGKNTQIICFSTLDTRDPKRALVTTQDAAFIAAANPSVVLRLLAALEAKDEALRRIAQGNLGDRAWEANYDAIRQVAQDALSPSNSEADNHG